MEIDDKNIYFSWSNPHVAAWSGRNRIYLFRVSIFSCARLELCCFVAFGADRIHARWSRTDAPVHIGKMESIFRCRKSARMQTTFDPDPFFYFPPSLPFPRPSPFLRSMWNSFRISSNNSRSIPSNYIFGFATFCIPKFRGVWHEYRTTRLRRYTHSGWILNWSTLIPNVWSSQYFSLFILCLP